jgi:hypothetical protein
MLENNDFMPKARRIIIIILLFLKFSADFTAYTDFFFINISGVSWCEGYFNITAMICAVCKYVPWNQ